MDPKVSIIIPVYNTKLFIKECLDSVMDQEYDNIEIILVDDGSTDGSSQLCDEYAMVDTRIKVIHKLNEGPGLARNSGVRFSKGEYVTFVDSDDKLDGPMTLGNMVDIALKNDADVVAGSFRRFNSSGELGVNKIRLKNCENVMDPDFRFRGFYQYNHLAYSWGKLYKKSFLLRNDLKHGRYSIAEDKAFNANVYACRPVYAFIEDSVYCYRVNDGSLTSSYRSDFIKVWVSEAADFSKFLKVRNIKDKIGDLSAFHIWIGSFFLIKQELQAGRSISEASKRLKEYTEIPYVRRSIKRIIAKDYTKGIKAKSWRWLIWSSSMALNLHFYYIFTIAIAMFMKVSGDEKISNQRYSK